jgi:hypothetical protein
MNATAFDSTVHSCVLFCGAAGAHVGAADLGWTVQALSLQQFCLLFLSSYGWAILKYLDAHPLTALVPDFEDALSRLNAELELHESIKNKGGGGNASPVATGPEPTAAPAQLPKDAIASTYRTPQ